MAFACCQKLASFRTFLCCSDGTMPGQKFKLGMQHVGEHHSGDDKFACALKHAGTWQDTLCVYEYFRPSMDFKFDSNGIASLLVYMHSLDKKRFPCLFQRQTVAVLQSVQNFLYTLSSLIMSTSAERKGKQKRKQQKK